MNDDQLDQLVARTSVLDDDRLASLDLTAAHADLLEAIVATPESEPMRVRRRTRSFAPAVIAASLAVVLAIGLPIWWTHRDQGQLFSSQGQEFSAQAYAVAEANPRVLVDEPGWEVDHVQEFTADEGEMSFEKGDRTLEVNWRTASSYAGYYEDRADIGPATDVTVLGQTGQMFSYSSDDFTVVLPVQGRSFLELRGGGADRAAFLALMEDLRRASVEEWLAAMPPSVVRPGEEQRVAAQMLADIPVPPGFDRDALPTGGSNDYYQYGVKVTGAVACGWIEVYRDARAAGDPGAEKTATDALATSRSWKVLQKMNAEGDWPEAIWELSDQLASGVLRSRSVYFEGLGCPR